MTIALDNGDEIQRTSEPSRPCKDASQYRIAVSCACSPILPEKETLEEEKKRGEKGRAERGGRGEETETFKVFQEITRKSYHRKRISPRFYSRRQEVPELRERSFELPSGTYLSPSVIRAACISSPRRASSPPRGRLSSRKITSLCVVRVDIYGERNNARARAGRSDSELVPAYVFTARKLPGPRSQTFLLK